MVALPFGYCRIYRNMSLTYPCAIKRALHSPCADLCGHTEDESLRSVQGLAAQRFAEAFVHILQYLRDKDQTP